MNDIVKLRGLIEKGYFVKDVTVDPSGKGMIDLYFSGKGDPVVGEKYFLITEDQVVIKKAKERIK